MSDQIHSQIAGKTVAIYTRVSVVEATNKGVSVGAQESDLRALCDKYQAEVFRVYADEDYSGTTDKRPEFKRMARDAELTPRPFDFVLVYDSSRFYRDVWGAMFYRKHFEDMGIKVITYLMPLDSKDPFGMMMQTMMDGMNAFWPMKTAADTRHRMIAQIKAGYFAGARAPIGYKSVKVKDENGNDRRRLEVDPVYGPMITAGAKRLDTGRIGLKTLANEIYDSGMRKPNGKPFDVSDLSYIYSNETYTGQIVWNRTHRVNGQANGNKARNSADEIIRMKGSHPVLIEPEVFARIRDLVTARNPRMTNPKLVTTNYDLSGLLRCSCGAAMSGAGAYNHAGKKYEYYVCTAKVKGTNRKCQAKRIGRGVLEDFVYDRIKEHILTPENIKAMVRVINDGIEAARGYDSEMLSSMRSKLAATESGMRNLFAHLEQTPENADLIWPQLRERKAEAEDLKRKIQDIEMKPAAEPINEARVREHIEDLRDTLLAKSGPLAKKFLQSFVREIVLDGDSVRVQYTLPLGPEATDVENGKVRHGWLVAPGVRWFTNHYKLKTG